jgi:hypothetical protein
MSEIISVGGLSYLPEAKAILAMRPSSEMFKEPDKPLEIGNYKIVPWGENNNLPAEIIEKIEKSEIVSANLELNVLTGYGTGIKPMRRIIENRKLVGYEEVYDDQKVLEFFENNDIPGYFLEQLTDLRAFYNVFPEIILSNDKKSIVTLRSKEAAFSRWGVMDKTLGRITKHYYSGKWGDNPNKDNITVTHVLDRFNPMASLEELKARVKEPRFILPINFPTPGRSYYQWAYWWSIFQSGWYDFSIMIPEVKKALLKNNLAVRFIIYLSPKYFKTIFLNEGIDESDKEAVEARVKQEHQMFNDFLTSPENAGKGIVTMKEMLHSATGAKEEKYLEIVEVPTSAKGGEFIQDSSEVSSIISYAMGVDMEMPGKNSGTMSGTDKRERFMIRQALVKPYRDRLLRPLTLIRNFNKWDQNIVFAVPDIEFPTLDKNKSGKEETIKT